MNKVMTKTVLGDLSIRKADSFLSRLKGLLFTKKLESKHCLLIVPCSSIHTLGMRYAIHIIFLSKNNTILAIRNNIKPNRFCIGPTPTYKVVELSADSIELPLDIIGRKFSEDKL